MKKIVSGLMIFLTIFMMMSIFVYPTFANHSCPNGFNKNYTLTGNAVSDMVAIATCQIGRTQSQIGYNEGWCDNFISDCAILAGQAHAVPQGSTVGDFLNQLLKAGAYYVSAPQAGDIVIFKEGSNCAHAALMVDGTNCINGNFWTSGYSQVEKWSYSTLNSYNGWTCVFVRPLYDDSSTITYTTISAGDYYIQNKSTGTYLTVQDGADVNTQNVLVASFKNSNAFKMKISATTTGYKIRPLCCSSRLVNPYADVVVSGKNVNIYDDVKDSSQWWRFESAGSGYYYIRNVQNPSCCLTVSGNDVKVSTYSGSNAQKWYLHPLSYKITYNANGGSGAPSAQTKYHAEKLTLSSTKPTRTGYTFLGWATSSSATSAEYAAGASYTANKKATFYAVWRANKLTAKFHANGGSVSKDGYTLIGEYCAKNDVVYTQKWTYNQTISTGFVDGKTLGLYRDGYTFVGWSTAKSGATVFDDHDGAIVPTDISTDIKNGDCELTMYAVWRPNKLKVYYNANGGSITSDTYSLQDNVIWKGDTKVVQTWTYNETQTNGLRDAKTYNLTRTGYTFVGWSTTTSGDIVFSQSDTAIVPTDLTTDIENGDCELTMYAVWRPNELKVYYNANGGTISSDTYSLSGDQIYKGEDPACWTWQYNKTKTNGLTNAESFGLTKPGYTFVGWSTALSDATVFDQTDESVTPMDMNPNVETADCEVTLYAIWEEAVLPGDSNGDGTIDMSDVVTIMRGVSGTMSEQYVAENSDYNQNGTVDMTDVVALLIALAG